MLSRFIPALIVLCCLWPTSAIVLGTESSRTTLFFEFTAVITTAATATGPDVTITGAETVVLDSTHIHVVEVMSVTNPVTMIEDCPLNNGAARRAEVCTIVEENATTTFTTTATVGPTASGSGTLVFSTTISATPTNGAARVCAAGASLLTGVVVGAALVGAMV